MITVGEFRFPTSTSMQMRLRVMDGILRKEIHLETILADRLALDELRARVEELEREIERFDRGQAVLSVVEGRGYRGKRLRLHRTLDPQTRMAVVEVLLATEDRYERSLAENRVITAVAGLVTEQPVLNAGNAGADLRIVLESEGTFADPAFSDGERSLVLHTTVLEGQVLELDGTRNQVTLDGTKAIALSSGSFPRLSPGETRMTLTAGAGSTPAGTISFHFHDTWV